MARADLFALPSRWEGFPHAWFEAMACDVPVLAADCCFGSDEIIEHGRNGWLVPPEDWVGMRNAIDTLITEPDLRWRLPLGARRAAELRSEVVLAEFEWLFLQRAWQATQSRELDAPRQTRDRRPHAARS